ncbi:MAG: hypothetical protein OQK98_12505 [Gammaproteobacteria bacterium]|nr:hypothetical protein [Gammaproteobacteria bacterium]
MSGMASTTVHSNYYTFYIDTGISVSLAPPPIIEGVDMDDSHYISDYFDRKEQALLETAANYMALIDLWVEDEISTYKTPLTDIYSKKASSQLSYICNLRGDSDTGEQNITLSLKYELAEEATQILQKRLCLWKEKYLPKKLIPIEIKHFKNITEETSFGSFTVMGGNLRSDVALKWAEYQLNSLEKWMPAVELAVTKIENRFKVKIISSQSMNQNNNMSHAHRVGSAWGPVFYSAWFEEEDKRYAEEVSYAIKNYIQEQEFSAQLTDALPVDTQQYLKNTKNINPIIPVVRNKMKDEIVNIENDLQYTFKPFDISITINIGKSASYPYDWEAIQSLHENLSLFKRILNEADEIGIKMKQNGVSIIEFSNHTWDIMPDNRINMTLLMNASKNNNEWSIDIHVDELKQKEKLQEFYEILLGKRKSDTNGLKIKII